MGSMTCPSSCSVALRYLVRWHGGYPRTFPPAPINDVKYRIDAKGRLIPYMLIRIPTTKLKKIVVGPCADYNSVKLMIDTVLLQHGIKDVTIVKSEVPYR